MSFSFAPAAWVARSFTRSFSSECVTGLRHEHDKQPCQDFVRSSSCDNLSIHALLDGHGQQGDVLAKECSSLLVKKTRHLVKGKPAGIAIHASAVREAFFETAGRVNDRAYSATSRCAASLLIFAPLLLTIGNAGDNTVVWAKRGREAIVVTSAAAGAGASGFSSGAESPRGAADAIFGGLKDAPSAATSGAHDSNWAAFLSRQNTARGGVAMIPMISQVVPASDEDFVIMASHEVWEASGANAAQDIVDCVRKCFNDGWGVKEACVELLRVAKERRGTSLNDASIVIVTQRRR